MEPKTTQMTITITKWIITNFLRTWVMAVKLRLFGFFRHWFDSLWSCFTNRLMDVQVWTQFCTCSRLDTWKFKPQVTIIESSYCIVIYILHECDSVTLSLSLCRTLFNRWWLIPIYLSISWKLKRIVINLEVIEW